MFAAKDIWVAVEVFSFRDADMTTGMVFSSGLSRPSSCQIRYWRRETLTWSKDDDASGKMISIFTFLESVPSSSFVKKHRLFFLSDHDGDDGFFAYLLLPETDHHLPLLQVVLLFFRHKFLASVHDSRLWPLLWENDHLSFAWNHHDDPFARFRLCFISYFSWQTRVAWTAGAVAWTWEETTTVEEVLLESLLFPLPVILRYFSFPFFERCRLSSHQSHRRPVSFKEEKRRTTCSSCLQNPWQSFFTLKVFFHHSSSFGEESWSSSSWTFGGKEGERHTLNKRRQPPSSSSCFPRRVRGYTMKIVSTMNESSCQRTKRRNFSSCLVSLSVRLLSFIFVVSSRLFKTCMSPHFSTETNCDRTVVSSPSSSSSSSQLNAHSILCPQSHYTSIVYSCKDVLLSDVS